MLKHRAKNIETSCRNTTMFKI